MHPRQASVLAEVQAVVTRLAAAPVPIGPVLLWKYEDPEGNRFFLESKKTTIKSPFTGKSFAAHPERYTPSQVGRELKEERKEQAKNAVDVVSYVDRIAAASGPVVVWQYADPGGNLFWLDRRITTALRSPYGGPQFTPKPEKIMPSQIGKVIKEQGDTQSLSWDDPPELRNHVAAKVD